MTSMTSIAANRRPEIRGAREHDYSGTNRNHQWLDSSLCVTGQWDPDLWFPVSAASPTTAYGVCQSCPVWRDCAQYAWDNGIVEGIWGGMNGAERFAYFRTGKLPGRWNAVARAMVLESKAHKVHLTRLGLA